MVCLPALHYLLAGPRDRLFTSLICMHYSKTQLLRLTSNLIFRSRGNNISGFQLITFSGLRLIELSRQQMLSMNSAFRYRGTHREYIIYLTLSFLKWLGRIYSFSIFILF